MADDPAKKAAAASTGTDGVGSVSGRPAKPAATKSATPKTMQGVDHTATVGRPEPDADPRPVRPSERRSRRVKAAEGTRRVKPVDRARRAKPAAPAQRVGATDSNGAPGSAGVLHDATKPVDELFRLVGELATQIVGIDADEKAAAAIAFLRRRLTGDYEVDPFGFDEQFTETVLLPLLRPLYRRWFRVEVRGVENIPAGGAALVVANHSGTIPLDSLMTQLAVHDEHPARRHLRMLGADLVFQLPFVADLARKNGTTLACNEDAERLFAAGELVGVWPEGFKGIGKPFSERYKLQRFGRGGFVSAAIRAKAPIVPCAIVGAEETYPLIGNLGTLARMIGVPYVPITPTFPWLGPLGLVPLPSKWIIEFGAPIATDDHGDGAADDPMLVFELTDRIRETIQQTLYSLLTSRRSTFL